MKRIFKKRGGCEDAEVLIQRSLDAPLSAAERHRLDAHLATCESCRLAWDEYRRLSRTASQWMQSAVQDPGDDFTKRVMAELGLSTSPESAGVSAETRPVTPGPSRRMVWGVSIAMLAALVAVGMFLPPITQYHAQLEGYAPSMGTLPTMSMSPDWSQFGRPEFGDVLSAFRSWTWPIYAFAGALVANVVFAGITARHRRRAL